MENNSTERFVSIPPSTESTLFSVREVSTKSIRFGNSRLPFRPTLIFHLHLCWSGQRSCLLITSWVFWIFTWDLLFPVLLDVSKKNLDLTIVTIPPVAGASRSTSFPTRASFPSSSPGLATLWTWGGGDHLHLPQELRQELLWLQWYLSQLLKH